MGIFRLYPDQDTSIANVDPTTEGRVYDTSNANVGASEILNLYKTTSTSGTAKILMKFDISKFPSVSGSYSFNMFDAQHGDTLPYGYNITVKPIGQDWDEGLGLDMDRYTDLGAANWVSASQGVVWAALSGTGSVTSSRFRTGHENLVVNVTELIKSASFGFLAEISQSGEYYIKKFHSRQSHFPTRRPYLELQYTDWTGTLSTSTAFYVTSGAYSGTVWPASMANTSASVSGHTGTFYTSDVNPTGALKYSLFNLVPDYSAYDVTKLDLQVQHWDWDPAVVTTASADTPSVVLTDCYYRVINVATNEEVVPYGTGSLKHTKLSYNDLGNYFMFNMCNLPAGQLYAFQFMYYVGSMVYQTSFDNFKFRVSELTNG